jgi:hypothetical protein
MSNLGLPVNFQFFNLNSFDIDTLYAIVPMGSNLVTNIRGSNLFFDVNGLHTSHRPTTTCTSA